MAPRGRSTHHVVQASRPFSIRQLVVGGVKVDDVDIDIDVGGYPI